MNNLTLLLQAFATWFYYIALYGLITIPTLAVIMLILNKVKRRYRAN